MSDSNEGGSSTSNPEKIGGDEAAEEKFRDAKLFWESATKDQRTSILDVVNKFINQNIPTDPAFVQKILKIAGIQNLLEELAKNLHDQGFFFGNKKLAFVFRSPPNRNLCTAESVEFIVAKLASASSTNPIDKICDDLIRNHSDIFDSVTTEYLRCHNVVAIESLLKSDSEGFRKLADANHISYVAETVRRNVHSLLRELETENLGQLGNFIRIFDELEATTDLSSACCSAFKIPEEADR